MASLVLASKIEEAVRRNRDIVNVFHYLKYKRANLLDFVEYFDYYYWTSIVFKIDIVNFLLFTDLLSLWCWMETTNT